MVTNFPFYPERYFLKELSQPFLAPDEAQVWLRYCVSWPDCMMIYELKDRTVTRWMASETGTRKANLKYIRIHWMKACPPSYSLTRARAGIVLPASLLLDLISAFAYLGQIHRSLDTMSFPVDMTCFPIDGHVSTPELPVVGLNVHKAYPSTLQCFSRNLRTSLLDAL